MRRRFHFAMLVLLVMLAACGQTEQGTPPPTDRSTATVAPTEDSAQEPAPTPETEPESGVTPGTGEPEGATPGVEASATPEAAAPATIALEPVAVGLTAPVALATAPDESGRRFIVDQIGLIRVVTAEGELLETPFLDLQERLVQLNDSYDERGLLGLAFHPDYAENGRFFVYYNAPLREDGPAEWDNTSHLSEFRVSADDPNLADPASERIILATDHPQFNHAGGTVAFGPDGYLYLSLGDGGGANDVGEGHVEDWYEENGGGNGQEVTESHLGKILRLDVDGAEPFAIPADNPFAGDREGLDEIYAYGFRNPYRFSFDMAGSNQLFVADAGQDLYEEISIVEAGGNYGWNVKEGTHCFSTRAPTQPPASCPTEDPSGNALVDPIIEYSHAEGGIVVVGGFVYRGSAIPALEGQYVFGNWSEAFDIPSGRLFAATPADEGLWPWQELHIAGATDSGSEHFILALGQDEAGELYILTTTTTGPTGNTGKVFRLIPAPEGSTTASPERTPTAALAGTVVEVQLVDYKVIMPSVLPSGPFVFEIANMGSMEHNFVLAGGSTTRTFELPMQPGETRRLPIELSSGRYQIYCPLANHVEMGMSLVLTVE